MEKHWSSYSLMPRSSRIFLCCLFYCKWFKICWVWFWTGVTSMLAFCSCSFSLFSLADSSMVSYRMHSQSRQYLNWISEPFSSRSRNCSICWSLAGSSSLSSMDFWVSSFLMMSLHWPFSRYWIACSLNFSSSSFLFLLCFNSFLGVLSFDYCPVFPSLTEGTGVLASPKLILVDSIWASNKLKVASCYD